MTDPAAYVDEADMNVYNDSPQQMASQDDAKYQNSSGQNKQRKMSKLRKIQSAMPSRDRSRLEKDRYREEKDRTQMKTMDSENAKSQAISVSKSYISHLENELNEEKRAREKLQSDIEQIKQINSEIS